MPDAPALVMVSGDVGGAKETDLPTVHRIGRIEGETLTNLYRGARVLFFPSLEEGFGWPIAEAMACGCPVITTGQAPMTEVGGDAAVYVPRSPRGELDEWARGVASTIREVLAWSPAQKEAFNHAAERQCARFQRTSVMERYEQVYLEVLRRHGIVPSPELCAAS
jgi:glycosyltransferase involved in cell wall biosynthesis